jgi:hypothetical protein
MTELREALESAVQQQEATDSPSSPESASAPEPVSPPAAPPTSASDDADTSSSSAPDDSDAKPSDTPSPGSEEKQQAAPDKAPETPTSKREHRIDRAPQAWKKEAKGEWANLPLHVRQEVYKRELEISRALSEAAPARHAMQQFQQTVSPFMARIQSNGVTPMQAVEHLFRADYTLATAPMPQRAQYMADLIKQYGIDIAELDRALVGQGQTQGQPQQPDISALVQQQVQQMVAPLLQREQAQQQRMQDEVVANVEQMALDPRFPFFEEVREDMADIIDMGMKRGVVISLEKAYDKATRMNDDVQSQMEQTRAASQSLDTHQKAQRALRASSSVSGAPAGGGSMQPAGDGSLRGAIEAAFGANRI